MKLLFLGLFIHVFLWGFAQKKPPCPFDCQQINFWQYKKGMKFYIPDIVALHQTDFTYPDWTSISGGSVQYSDLAKRNLELIDVHISPRKSYIDPDFWTYRLTLVDRSKKDSFVYTSVLDYRYLDTNAIHVPEANIHTIKNAVYVPDIEEARNRLIGKPFYFLRPLRQRRFEPITITKIDAGSWETPIRIHFSTREIADTSIEVNICGTNVPGSFVSAFYFGLYFVCETPQRQLEADTDTWNIIRAGRLRKGLTLKQVEFALGKPTKVKESIVVGDDSIEYTYPDFRLTFREGVLVKIE